MSTTPPPNSFTDQVRSWTLSVMTSGDFVTVEEAASALGVSARHARRLVKSGRLAQIAGTLVDHDSVERYLLSQGQGRTRAWADHTAWGAISLLYGGDADWLGPTQRSRVRRTLRDLTDPIELVARVRNRARPQTFAAHRAALPRLRSLTLQPNVGLLGIVDSGEDRIDGYLAARDRDSLVRSLGLRADPAGDVTLRITEFDFDQVRRLVTGGVLVAAIDIATSLDPRQRGVGQRAMAEILDGYR
ncbi:helix-turn-helix domain-containing protein [Nocardia sp. NPDC059177]|uniref:helix-turn-helix domain-containing protein n=1 Tax=Nocardia sp. NPDC059177 TaxID=3346759 RepID=UPI0036D09753